MEARGFPRPFLIGCLTVIQLGFLNSVCEETQLQGSQRALSLYAPVQASREPGQATRFPPLQGTQVLGTEA